jgi:putative addiction module killer protein
MTDLRGEDIHGIILTRLDRVRQGNLGNHKSVGKGVSELIFDVGPGYRVYFGQDGNLIILLLAGSKKTQADNILQAQKYWRDYHA